MVSDKRLWFYFGELQVSSLSTHTVSIHCAIQYVVNGEFVSRNMVNTAT